MARSRKAGRRSRGKAPLRVLLVEDDADTRSLLREILTIHGCSVVTAGGRTEAEKIVSKRTFDVIVSDVRMPGGNGIELARRLAGRKRRARVILITAFPGPRTPELGYAAGAVRILSKPFSLEKFARLVEQTGRECRPRA